MDPSVLALLGSIVLVAFALFVFAAILYLPLVWANKILRGLIRTFRSTARLITTGK